MQAFDQVLGQWLNALSVGSNTFNVKWAGYSAMHAGLPSSELRAPKEERALDRRRPILKSNFPKRQHPKYLQKGDCVVILGADKDNRGVVSENDCFTEQR